MWHAVFMEKTTLYLPTELLAIYSTIARESGRSRAEVMRDALGVYVEHQERELPAWIGMLDTGDEFDSSNVKSWLRERSGPA